MIKTETSVPETYYRDSRDFQFLGRVFDAALNSYITNSEMVGTNPFSYNFNTKLIDLLTLTLGFKSRHHYNINQLTAMCAALTEALRWKGTKKSIQLAADALLKAEGVAEPAVVDVNEETSTVTIFLPIGLADTNLLNDMLDYILPAGMSCDIVKQMVVNTKEAQTTVTQMDTIEKFANKLAAETSVVPESGDVEMLGLDTPGLIDNTTVVGKQIKKEEGE